MKSKYIRKKSALFQAGIEKLRAERALYHEWRKFWPDLPQLEDGRFKELLPIFIEEVRTFCIALRRTNGIECAAGELFRKAVTNESEPLGYTFDDALLFARTYREVERRLDPLLAPLFDFHGDRFGDLLDSIPLAGPDALQYIDTHHAEFHSAADLSDVLDAAAKKACGRKSAKRFRKLLSGENFVALSLEEQAQRYWLHIVSDVRRHSEEKDRN